MLALHKPSATINLSWPQTRAAEAFTRGATVTLPWGRGGGKTWFILFSALCLVIQWEYKRRFFGRGVRIVILMPVLAQARKTILPRFRNAIDGLDPTLPFRRLGGKFNASTLRCEFPGGSWIQFVSQEQGIRGIRCDAIYSDECDDIRPTFYQAVVSPWLSEPESLRLRMLGGTPTNGRFGLLYQNHRLALAGHPGFYSFHHTWKDFPEHVSAEHALAERAAAIANGRLATFEREWECNFDAGEGLVYSMFDREFHVREPAPDAVWSEILVGVDHGWEDPGCFLVIGVAGHGRDAICHVIHEVYKQHRDETWWCQQVGEVLKLNRHHVPITWYPDPSRPDRVHALKRAGARVAQDPISNNIDDGVLAVAARFGIRRITDEVQDQHGNVLVPAKRVARLYVSRRCENTIRELENYRRKPDSKDPERFTDEIEDKNNHAMDPLRYALYNRFGGPEREGALVEGAGWQQ